MKIHVGTSGYAYKEWKGKFYPEKIPSKEMLRFYSGRLNAVEINNTLGPEMALRFRELADASGVLGGEGNVL